MQHIAYKIYIFTCCSTMFAHLQRSTSVENKMFKLHMTLRLRHRLHREIVSCCVRVTAWRCCYEPRIVFLRDLVFSFQMAENIERLTMNMWSCIIQSNIESMNSPFALVLYSSDAWICDAVSSTRAKITKNRKIIFKINEEKS